MRVMSYRTRNFLIAGLLGVLAVALTIAYTTSIKKDNNSATNTGPVTVLVAARDIPLGTAGASVNGKSWVKVEQLPANQVAKGAVKSPAALKSLVAVQPTYKGEQVLAQRFGTTQQLGLLSQMHGTLRVFELAGDTHQVLADTLKQGNRVDVVASLRNPESGTNHFATIAVRNVLVVGTPEKPSSTAIGDQSASVDLLLTTTQAQRLFWIEKNADWSLLLRPSTKAKDQPIAPVSSEAVVEAGSGK